VSVTRRYCIETAARIELFFEGGLGYLQRLQYSLLELRPNYCVPNSGLRKFRHDTPTVGECDINSDSGRSGVDSTWQRRPTSLLHGTCDVQRTTIIADTRRAALYTARWSIDREGHSSAGSIGMSLVVSNDVYIALFPRHGY